MQDVLEAVASPRRRQILRLVWDDERSAGEIAARFDVSWPAVSQNIGVLRRAGLLTERREGNRRYYRADRAALGPLEAVLREMWTRELDELDAAMERERRADRVLEVQRHLAAPPEDVFGFLTDQARYVRWMGRSAELDPRPGGIYRVDMGGDIVAEGTYVELQPHSRIVFTWGWVGNPDVPPGSSTVEIALEPDAEGTLLTLRHTGLPDEAAVGLHREGWEMYLDRLVVLALGEEPPPFAHP